MLTILIGWWLISVKCDENKIRIVQGVIVPFAESSLKRLYSPSGMEGNLNVSLV